MPAPSKKLQKLQLFARNAQETCTETYPHLGAYLAQRNVSVSDFRNRPQSELSIAIASNTIESEVHNSLSHTAKQQKNDLLSQVSSDEYVHVLQKMMAALALPAGRLDPESQLYLEQQVSELIGIEASAQLDNHTLPFNTGRIEALPHLRRYPNDSIKEHDAHAEAGLNPFRSYFGWFTEGNQLNQLAIRRERYAASIPLFLIEGWRENSEHMKTWYKYKKVLLINPFNQRAVVACIADNKRHHTLQYQFGGSPEIIREGFFWSPEAQGRACMLFIDDPEDRVSLGSIDFSSVAAAKE